MKQKTENPQRKINETKSLFLGKINKSDKEKREDKLLIAEMKQG